MNQLGESPCIIALLIKPIKITCRPFSVNSAVSGMLVFKDNLTLMSLALISTYKITKLGYKMIK